MIHGGLRAVLGLSLLAAFGACEGGEIVIFTPVQAGSAGRDTNAGAPGFSGGSGGSSGDSAGTGGIALSGSGGGGEPVGRACQSSDDCDLSWYCEKPGCAAPNGVCVPIPISDDPRFAPVCSCDDRISYWNDTVRQVTRVSASKPGWCQSNAKPCMSGDECGPFGACRLEVHTFDDCKMADKGTGQCWAIPNDCEFAGNPVGGFPCPPLPPGTPPPCLTLCEVLQADMPYLLPLKDLSCQ